MMLYRCDFHASPKRRLRPLIACARCGAGVQANGGTRHCGPCRSDPLRREQGQAPRQGEGQVRGREMTFDEAFKHLSATFDLATRMKPDAMEPYVVRLAEARDQTEQIEIMRCGLRETIAQRFPLRGRA
jgi:hypothetical protein